MYRNSVLIDCRISTPVSRQVHQPVRLSAFVRSPLTVLRQRPETSRRPLRSRDLRASDVLEILTKGTLPMNGDDAIGRPST